MDGLMKFLCILAILSVTICGIVGLTICLVSGSMAGVYILASGEGFALLITTIMAIIYIIDP